jgi:succinoglycan biosynthesis transport protein ExoP
MSDQLVPSGGDHSPLTAYQPPPSMSSGPPVGPAKNPIERPLAAVRRYKWLVLAVSLLGAAAGVLGSRYITPQFEVRSIVWLEAETPDNQARSGPIRSGSLLNAPAWVELLRSYRVVDEVVRKLTLYVVPEKPADAPLFAGFEMTFNRFVPGQYEIDIDPKAKTWVLKGMSGAAVERGGLQDSIGRPLGFRWTLPPFIQHESDPRQVRFSVTHPRDKSADLISHLGTHQDMGSNFLWLTYRANDPALAARTLNTWAAEFVKVAAELKTKNVVEFSKVLDGQLQYSEAALKDAERSLETFRVHTITLPAEGGPVAAGVQETRDPAMNSFFRQKIEYDNLKQDREALEKMIAGAAEGRVPYEGVLQIPSVSVGSGAQALVAAFGQRTTLRAQLATERTTFTDSMPSVKRIMSQLDVLEKQTIPILASQVLAQLREREGDYQRRIGGASKELQAVPARTMEEMRLNRAVKIADGLYTMLKQRYAEARLAEASTAADINILDPAVAPSSPTKNTAPMIMLGGVAGGIGFAIALAILLDMMDRRFRYPDQATEELGLTIAGTVPRLPRGGVNPKSPEQVLQLVESFRSLRMHVMHSVTAPVAVAISSPAPGDGKSLVSANLAMSFAEAGIRTLLIDGDTRRGALHEMFGTRASPGLTDYLIHGNDPTSLVQATPHDKLWILPCGPRDRRSPELLSTARLPALVQHFNRLYDVVIFDTPPFAAGIDGYAIAAATGNLLLVVRIGQTERRLAAAKLAIADRLPINMIGTVLNSVDLNGAYQYYSYAAGYGVDESKGELAETVG